MSQPIFSPSLIKNELSYDIETSSIALSKLNVSSENRSYLRQMAAKYLCELVEEKFTVSKTALFSSKVGYHFIEEIEKNIQVIVGEDLPTDSVTAIIKIPTTALEYRVSRRALEMYKFPTERPISTPMPALTTFEELCQDIDKVLPKQDDAGKA